MDDSLRHARWVLLAGAAMVLGACEQSSPGAVDLAEGALPPPEFEGEACADGGAPLPITGMCPGRAVNYLDPDAPLIGEAYEPCRWIMQETPFPGGDQAVLYLSQSCDGDESRLEMSAGAQSAVMTYAPSDDGLSAGTEAVRIFGDGMSDPMIRLEALAEAARSEGMDCAVQSVADPASRPSDAYEIVPSETYRAQYSLDEPADLCGPWGRMEDSQTYWRVFGGYAWYFDLGQDIPQIDPASFMLFERAGDIWVGVE